MSIINSICILLTLLLGLVNIRCSLTKEQKPKTVIAVVDGQEILYEEIKVDLEFYRRMHPRLDETRLKEAAFREEKRRLLSSIRFMFMERKIEELGLTVADEELDKHVAEMHDEAGMTEEVAEKVIRNLHTIAAAIEEWQKNPERSDAIYKEKLAPLNIPEIDWEAQKRYYDTLEKLEKFRSMLPKEFEDIKIQSRPGVERQLLEQKLREAVTPDIRISEEDVEKYYREKYESVPEEQIPDLAEVQDSLKQELLSKKRWEAYGHWLQKQFKSADIKILEERFKDIVKF